MKKIPSLMMSEYLQRTNIDENLALVHEVRYRVFEILAGSPVAATSHVEQLQDLFLSRVEGIPTIGVAGTTS